MAYDIQRTWVCPFYKWDERLCVHCEGGGRAAFPDRETAKDYADRYCGSLDGWEKCTLAAARVRYYERTDKEPPGKGRPRGSGGRGRGGRQNKTGPEEQDDKQV